MLLRGSHLRALTLFCLPEILLEACICHRKFLNTFFHSKEFGSVWPPYVCWLLSVYLPYLAAWAGGPTPICWASEGLEEAHVFAKDKVRSENESPLNQYIKKTNEEQGRILHKDQEKGKEIRASVNKLWSHCLIVVLMLSMASEPG